MWDSFLGFKRVNVQYFVRSAGDILEKLVLLRFGKTGLGDSVTMRSPNANRTVVLSALFIVLFLTWPGLSKPGTHCDCRLAPCGRWKERESGRFDRKCLTQACRRVLVQLPNLYSVPTFRTEIRIFLDSDFLKTVRTSLVVARSVHVHFAAGLLIYRCRKYSTSSKQIEVNLTHYICAMG